MIVGIGHVDLVCRDLERSLAFYAAVLGPLGLEPPVTVEGERGEAIHYHRFPRHGSGSLGLREASGPEAAQPFELYAPGFHHVSFAVEERAEVEAAHANAVAAGAEILHAPRLFPRYRDDYYATFFLDPDGFRLEVATARDARVSPRGQSPRTRGDSHPEPRATSGDSHRDQLRAPGRGDSHRGEAPASARSPTRSPNIW